MQDILKDSNLKVILTLFFVSLIFYLSIVLTSNMPFVYDEGSYAIMIHEFSINPQTILPTITHRYTEWKPPLFTWIYSILYLLIKPLEMSAEITLRIPSTIFGAIDVCLVYLIALKFLNKNSSIIASIFFLTSPVIIFSSTLLMMEAFATFLSLLGVYFYLQKKFFHGALVLSALLLVKWLYVGVPLLFIVAYFYKSKEFSQVVKSGVLLPVFFVLYLIISYLLGSYQTTIVVLSLDLSRPAPNFELTKILIKLAWAIVSTAPLSFFFIHYVKNIDLRQKHNLALVAVAAVCFVMTLSNHYIFWYSSTTIFALAILAVSKADFQKLDQFSIFIVITIIALNLVFYYPIQKEFRFQGYDDLPQVANFISGKEVQFIEPTPFYPNWWTINKLYNKTNESYLLLEQSNPGFLFYRFHNSTDYQNVKPVFSYYGETPKCGDYAVYHRDDINEENKALPKCFTLIMNTTNYEVYNSTRH